MPVTDGLSQRHYVGHHTLCLEHPEVCAGTTKAGLYFIGDEDSPGSSNGGIGFAQVSPGQDDFTPTTQRRLARESGKAVAGITDLARCLRHVGREELSGPGPMMWATIDIRPRNLTHP